MVGPSSSHTAGARAHRIDPPASCSVKLPYTRYFSARRFALTGHGHGTDCALIGRCCSVCSRMTCAFQTAMPSPNRKGCRSPSPTVQIRNAHPNTARLQLTGASGRTLDVVAESIGGGRIRVSSIDGIEANFSGEHNTLIVHNQDTPGTRRPPSRPPSCSGM